MRRINYFNTIFLIALLVFCLLFISAKEEIFAKSNSNKNNHDYSLAWPGILPDSPLYKIKVLRNKIIEKMILTPVKRIEFDLLMADKTIYASKLLLEKREIAKAKETALKGENYYSMLVQDYNKAIQQGKKIPLELDQKITFAAQKHQQIFKELENKVTGQDKETFRVVNKFSRINYDFIVGLRNSKKKTGK